MSAERRHGYLSLPKIFRLRKVYLAMQNQFGIIQMIQQGYYATYPLILISVVCLAIIFERVWALCGIGTRATKTADALIGPLRQGKFNEALQRNEAAPRPRPSASSTPSSRAPGRWTAITAGGTRRGAALRRAGSSSSATSGCSRPRAPRPRSSGCSAPSSVSWSRSSRWRSWAPAASRSSRPVFRRR